LGGTDAEKKNEGERKKKVAERMLPENEKVGVSGSTRNIREDIEGARGPCKKKGKKGERLRLIFGRSETVGGGL